MPVLKGSSLEFISKNTEQTRRIGMHIGAFLQPGDLICLVGDLGSGKTTLVQGMTAGWGSLDAASSPTFVLVNVYRRPDGHKFYHLDAYRLIGVAEAEELDLTSMNENGPMVIEWADRIEAALPKDRLWVSLDWVNQDQRDFVCQAQGTRYQALLQDLRKQVFGVSR
jgi:tRNA threonylcarbamoyladenosine biosynthesis protein TsaE